MVATTSYPRGPSDPEGRTAVATTAALGSSLPRAASTRTTLGRIPCAPAGAFGGGGTNGGGASRRMECAARSLKAMMRFPATGLSPSALAAAARQPVMSLERYVGWADCNSRRAASRSKEGAAIPAPAKPEDPAQSPTVAGSSGPSRSSAASASLRAFSNSVLDPMR